MKMEEPTTVETEDPMHDVRVRAARRLTTDIMSKIKVEKTDSSGDAKLAPSSPYTIGNVLWLTAAFIVFRYAQVAEAVLYDPRIDRFYFNIGVGLISVNVAICIFCVIWLSFIKQVESSQWEVMYPAAIPVATVSFILGAIFLTVGLWPVWSFLTPPILFVLFMGFVVLVAIIPPVGFLEEPQKKRTVTVQNEKFTKLKRRAQEHDD